MKSNLPIIAQGSREVGDNSVGSLTKYKLVIMLWY
jgi:hypothetical protein